MLLLLVPIQSVDRSPFPFLCTSTTSLHFPRCQPFHRRRTTSRREDTVASPPESEKLEELIRMVAPTPRLRHFDQDRFHGRRARCLQGMARYPPKAPATSRYFLCCSIVMYGDSVGKIRNNYKNSTLTSCKYASENTPPARGTPQRTCRKRCSALRTWNKPDHDAGLGTIFRKNSIPRPSVRWNRLLFDRKLLTREQAKTTPSPTNWASNSATRWCR